MRRRVKAMSYGLAYGLSAFGLSKQLKISADEARGQMDAYFDRFGGVRDYLRSVVEVARQTGYTETIWAGAGTSTSSTATTAICARWPNGPPSTHPSRAVRPTSSRSRCSECSAAWRPAGLRTRLLLQVHDELVLEIAPGEHDRVEALVREHMGNAYPLDVPLDVSVGFGRTSHEAAHSASYGRRAVVPDDPGQPQADLDEDVAQEPGQFTHDPQPVGA